MRKRSGSWRGISIVALLAAMLLVTMLAACSRAKSDNDSAANKMAGSAAMSMEAPAEQRAVAYDQTGYGNEEQGLPPVADTYGYTSATTGSGTSAAPAIGESAGDPGYSGPAVGSGAGGIGTIADGSGQFGRKVIYNANLVMEVEKFSEAEAKLLNLIHLSGAYVLQFSDSRSEYEVGANYVIKVPSEGFSAFLSQVQQIDNKLFERQVQGSDVTEEYVDLAARLKAQEAVEARLLGFMEKATASADLLKFSNELAAVQQQIEQIKGRMRYLDQNVAFSTVSLRLYEPVAARTLVTTPEKEPFGERLAGALTGSLAMLRQAGEAVLVAVVALLPVLAVLGVLGVPSYFLVRRMKYFRRPLPQQPPEDPQQ